MEFVTASELFGALIVIIDVFRIPPPEDQKFPDGYKFSFGAFIKSEPDDQVRLDCLPPKKPHYHEGEMEIELVWTGIEGAAELFWEKVEFKFGKLRPKKGG